VIRPARLIAAGALTVCMAGCIEAAGAPPAAASPICSAAGWVSGIAGKACGVLEHGSKIVSAGKKLLSGHAGAAAKTLLGGGATAVGRTLGLAAIGAWVIAGAKAALHATVALVGHTTNPQLETTWFSGTYWRVAGVAAVLTLPFLFAAAIQALMRSDLTLLLRASLGYLPLALLGVSIAAPVTMLLLAASDQLSAVVAGATGEHALAKAGLDIGVVSTIDGSPFLAFLLGLFLVVAAAAVWLELVVREAAVYVVVLMLPLTFAALVWPARRIWAVRTVELLVALILSKFAIVAVLSLAGAAVGHSVSGMIAMVALFTMAAFAPWALVRLFPLAELASGAAGSLRGELTRVRGSAVTADRGAERTASTIEGEPAEPEEDGAASRGGGGREAAHDEWQRLGQREPMPVAAGGRDGAAGEADEIERESEPEVGEAVPARSYEPGLVGGEDGATTGAAEPEALSNLVSALRCEDGSSPPLILGPEELTADRQPGSAQPGSSHSADRQPESAADHDPRPATQDPEDGVL
jgi:hypothetical protein